MKTQPDPDTYFPEAKIGGRYEVLGLIGTGGSALVFRAYDEMSDEVVALKTLRLPENLEHRKAFAAEATLLKKIDHENVVSFRDFFTEEDGRDWMVMDYVAGTDLEKIMESVNSSPMNAETFEKIAAQALNALDALHRDDVLHLDIKPQNILVNHIAETGTLKVTLIDFGASTTTCSADQDCLSQRSGSIFYTSPESFSGKTRGKASDIYSLGCVFYFLLTGREPFEGDNDVEVMASHLMNRVIPLGAARKDLPWNIITMVSQMLAMEMKDRPSSALDVWSNLSDRTGALSNGKMATAGGTAFLPVARRGGTAPSERKTQKAPIRRDLVPTLDRPIAPFKSVQKVNFS